MTEAFPHQTKCMYKVKHFGGNALIADEQGLGKTMEALLATDFCGNFPAIVVCPSSLKLVWQREARLHFGINGRVLYGRTLKENEFLSKERLVILNFEILKAWLPRLKKMGAKTLIVDECQAIKNRHSQQYKNIKELVHAVPHFLALSGTPLTNRPSEMWPVLNLLRPDIWPSFFPFAMKHCQPTRKPWGMVYNGAERLDELHADASRYCMIRRLKKDVLDLPEKITSVVPLEISNRKEYERAEKDFLKWLKERKGTSAYKKAKKAAQVVAVGYWRRMVAEQKIPAVIDWVKTFLDGTDEKLVLMGCHKLPLQKLHDQFEDIAVRLDGTVSTAKARMQAVDSFQNDQRVRLFLGNIRAAGTGITLTAASTLAFFEIDWTPGAMEQASDRIHRIGQKRTSNICWLIAARTIEETIAEIVQEKSKVISNVLDGGNKEIISVYDSLMDLV